MKGKQIHFGILVLIFSIFTLSPSLVANNSDFPIDLPNNASFSPSTLKILTTTMIPYDIAQNILGNLTDAEVIVEGSIDIHTFQGPTTQQMQNIAAADILFSLGIADLEPWLADTLTALGSDAPPVVKLIDSSMIRTDPVLDGSLNPHVWLDPTNMKSMTNTVTSELIALDPLNSVIYQTNNMTYQVKLDNLLNSIAGNKTLIQGTKCVTWHPAFTYFLDLLGMDQIATMEKVEGQEPSNAYISTVVTKMKQQNCKLIIGQPQIPATQINEIAIRTESQIATLTDFPGITTSFGQVLDSYVEMMQYNLWALQNPNDPNTDGTQVDGYSIPTIILMGIIGLLGICGSVALKRKKER
jgi:zinc transport system substrate-binding protein